MAPGRSSSPIRPLVVLGIISLMAGLASLFLVRIFHRPLGLLGDYKVREAYHCDTLRVRTDHFSLEIHGGMCIPGYRDGIITGLAVLGDGEFVFPVPMQYYSRYRVDKVRDSLDIAYFAIHPDDYETLKTLNGFYPAQTENYVDTARVIFSRNKRTSYNFNGWGMIPVKGGLNCRMYTRNLGVVHHFEAHEIALSSASRTISFPNPEKIAEPARPGLKIAILLHTPLIFFGYIVLALIFLFIIKIMTADTAACAGYQRSLPAGRFELRLLISVICIYVLISLVFYALLKAHAGMAAKYFAIPAYILLLLAVFFLLRRRGFDRSYFGITARNLSRGMIIALILIPATLAAEIMMRGGGLSVHKVSIHYIIDRLVWYLVFVGLLEELFYRGYVQTTLERLLGPTRGLYLASLVMGFTHIFQRLFLRGQNLEAALISGLVIIPLGCLPWGYLFQRTRNIFPVVFLHGMLDFLPRILGG